MTMLCWKNTWKNSVFLQVYSTSHDEWVEVRLLVLIRYTVELLLFAICFWDEVTCK